MTGSGCSFPDQKFAIMAGSLEKSPGVLLPTFASAFPVTLPPLPRACVVAFTGSRNDGKGDSPSRIRRAETSHSVFRQASCPQFPRVANLLRLLALLLPGVEPQLASPFACSRDPSQMSRSQHQAWPTFRLLQPDCVRQVCRRNETRLDPERDDLDRALQGLEIIKGDVFLMNGIIKVVGRVDLESMGLNDRDEVEILDAHGAYVTPGYVFCHRLPFRPN
jgi:hypothetical protein